MAQRFLVQLILAYENDLKFKNFDETERFQAKGSYNFSLTGQLSQS